YAIPNFVGHGLGGLAVQGFFLELDLFSKLDGEELLRRAFGFIAAHGPSYSPGNGSSHRSGRSIRRVKGWFKNARRGKAMARGNLYRAGTQSEACAAGV